MKLIPKAKPVKIRIKSGGQEHSSLESLMCNFDISDIKPLLDGRLERWLRQQGENEYAESVHGMDDSSLDTIRGAMCLMKIFFHEYIEKNGINDLLSLTESWLKSPFYRKNGENLCFYITLFLCNDQESLDYTKYLYKHKEELEIPKTEWYTVFALRINEEDEDKSDPEVLYIVGKMLWEGYQFNDLYPHHYKGDPEGLEKIEKAARLGCQEANLFIFEYNRQASSKGFGGVDMDELKRLVNTFWTTPKKDILFKLITSDDTNAKVKEIGRFVRHCHFLRSDATSSYDTLLHKAFVYFCPNNERPKADDFLKSEKCFIIGLIYKLKGYPSKAKSAFIDAGDYPPAQYMLSDREQIDGCKLKAMTFQDQITFVVKHLFDYE